MLLQPYITGFRFDCKRLFSISSFLQNVITSELAALRKKTGYSLSNCRKALELHGNDKVQAEKWLREQAQALGWDKAQKLQGRSTSQGLIGITLQNKKAVLVEVNCETDFVARNSQFKSLVENVVRCCLHYPVPKNTMPFSETLINSEELSNLKSLDGCSLGNLITLLVGNVGENVVLKRALCCEVFDDNIHIAIDAHPPSNSQDVLLGKFGSLVVYSTEPAEGDLSVQDIGLQLCKHIIGMNPVKVGVLGVDNPVEDIDEEGVMINQEFLLDSSLTVGQFLQGCRTKVLHFNRFACGESIRRDVLESEKIPACQ